MIQLRDYQDDCVSGVREAYRAGHTSVVLVAPTGAGKTVMFAYIAMQSASRGKRVLILALPERAADAMRTEADR